MINKKRIQFIVNPISGTTKKLGIVEQIKKFISPDIEYSIVFTAAAGHATELSLDAIKNGFDAVVAVGGDGSVNEVGKALINSKVALGVIPAGSGNGFARHFKIPMSIRESIGRINQFNTQIIDTAIANGKPFLATTGTGFDSHIAQEFSNFSKRGLLSYAQLCTREFSKYKAEQYLIKVDQKEMNTNAFLIVVANTSQYGNNVWIAPSASATSGLLNVGILKQFPVSVLPDIILRLFNKTIEKSNLYTLLQGKEIRIKKIPHFHIDGEPNSATEELVIKVNPSSLRIIC